MAHRPAQRKKQRKKQAKLNRELRAEHLRTEHLRAEQRRLVATPSQCWFLLQPKSCFLMLAGWVWPSKYEVQSGKRHRLPNIGRRHRKWRADAVQTVSDRPLMSSLLFPFFILLLVLLVLARFVPPKWLPKFMAWLPPSISFVLPVAILVSIFLQLLSGWPTEQAWLLLITIWPQWALTLLLSEEKSLEDYVRANAVTKEHELSAKHEDKDPVLVCTQVGMNVWSGFIEVIIKAYRCNRSWGGEFSSEDLRMSGHRCRISLDPTFPASFPNLLRDFAKLAHLLISHFKVEGKHEVYIRFLYGSMIKPGASETTTPDGQEDHIKFIRNHPALRSLRTKRLFLEDVIKAYRSMGRAEKERFTETLQKIKAGPDWRLIAQRNASFSRVLFFKSAKHVFVYQPSTEDLFRFFRNFFAHGSDADSGQEIIGNLEDIDCIDTELMPKFVTELFRQMIVSSNLSGKFEYAWRHYGWIQ